MRDLATAIILELIPLELPLLGVGGILFLTSFEPPTAVWVVLSTPIFFCLASFGLSGVGWFQFGYRREGFAMFVGRGILSLWVALLLIKTIGEVDCGGTSCHDYSNTLVMLLWPSILLPIGSAAVLVVRLITRRPTSNAEPSLS